MDGHLRLPLRQVVWGGDAGSVGDHGVCPAGAVCVEVALFALLSRWGVVPDFVMGHSVGELAAAYVAGVLSLPDAANWWPRGAG